ncbi:1-pyrroline-5-carboxylate dehydrogenase [candidate division BRC1 bacterium SM23_51]|nr:MAG: 1-pyrroline-5-carboxylate dehydrogenase [candidate division BRC1 bacterium SM23_51]
MTIEELEPRIVARGRDFFAGIRNEVPSLFNKSLWTGKVMDWCMKNDAFKVQLFRFVDVFPSLTSGRSLSRHILEYFGGENQDVPSILKWGAKGAGLAGAVGAKVLSTAIRMNIQNMAKLFIVGETTKDAVRNLLKLRKQGFAFTVDVLGEATVSEEEAERYVAAYLDLLGEMEAEQAKWETLRGNSHAGEADDLDWGHSPKINISVKPSALYSQANPADFEGSVQNILARMERIYERVVDLGGFMCVDVESYKYKDITLEVFRRLRSRPRFRDYPHLGVVAKQNGWEIPVYTHKSETDAAYERQARKILENQAICHLACGSHNTRTICALLEMAHALDVPADCYEFQVLYGMAEPVRKVLLKQAKRVRLYCPYGELIPGMAYLVRRLLENTANESFLRQSFAEQLDVERLLENPLSTLEQEQRGSRPELPEAHRQDSRVSAFMNEPLADFTKETQRKAFPEAITRARKNLGSTYPLFIGGKNIETDEKVASENPAAPSEVIGQVCQAGTREIASAIAAAKEAFPAWRDTPCNERAQYLLKVADIARRRLFELAAWQVLEVGKQWDQAHADVTEAIDFLRYYAQEMIRLGSPRRPGTAPGEVNFYFYEPKGIVTVIAPWNFPLAISCGMCAAAIVTGNCVVYKPSGLSAVVGHNLLEILCEAGLPPGVFNYTPGRGSVIGDFLVEHPDISAIAFTGSLEVGLRIIEKAARVRAGQLNVKRVIAEMGGKNAIIIDDDADLDEAVPAVLYSAFGFQGQKCSACSRAVVLEAVYDRFVQRLVAAARSMRIGPAEDPANAMGPVVDAAAQKSILEYIEIGRKEGRVLYSSEVPDSGYYVPMTIIDGITPERRIAQEEVFGPVLAVMRVRDFDQALEWANSTQFALTGGVFSRSPKHLERASREFRVGNLYLNRQITGAFVHRQPFGGARMSGVGSKAGGPDYLLQFMDPRTTTENTMRRGFTPIAEADDWVE